MVNITGHHFGEVETDLVGVWLSGVPCRTYRWINGRQVLCESAALPRQSGKYHSGPVIVQTLTGGKGSSTAENSTLQWTYNSRKCFKFCMQYSISIQIAPQLTSVYPESGPEAGGTVLLLTGSNLGQDELDLLSITIADGRPCTSIKWTSSAVVHCVTAPARSEGGGYIDEPINGPIVITTRSGGRWAADWSPSINFTYNPSPLVT
jgi:hypothetical protein